MCIKWITVKNRELHPGVKNMSNKGGKTMYQHGGDIYRNQVKYDFSANINPLGIPEEIVAAAYEGILQSAHYPDSYCEGVIEAISKEEKVAPSQIIMGNGAAELIFAICNTLRPKKALLLAPTFGEYEQALTFQGCQVEYYYLRKENNFAIQETYLDEIEKKYDVIFLCNPNNPTGDCIPGELLKQIIKKAAQYNTTVVVDECFQEFLDQELRTSVIPWCDEYTNVFVLKAFTKLYAMAGLRLGYGISSNQALLRSMRLGLQPWNVSIPAQKAGEKALELKDYVARTEVLIRTERKYLKEQLNKLGYEVYGSHANYIFFSGDENLYEYCLQNKFLIRSCSNYVGLGPGYYRIAVRTHEENKALVNCLWKKKEENTWQK